jgi:hypothetical protein
MRDREARRRGAEQLVDDLFAELLAAGENASALRGVLERASPDETALVGLLRRAVPVRLLEHLASAPPWCDRPLVLGAIVRNPRVPRGLGLKLLSSLFWHDLAEVAANPWTQGALRVRAEGLLRDMLEEMRLGDKIALGRIATPPVIASLLQESDPKIVEAVLLNPRLKEEELLRQMRSESVAVELLEGIANTSRWHARYAIRLGLVLQPKTPLAIALAQVSGLVRRDLLRIAETPGLKPLLQAAALRVANESSRRNL